MAEKERLYLRLDVGLESEMLNVGENPAPGTHTHRWTLFVRGVNDTPIDSQLISKIVFQLHEDFNNPKRIVTSPPYQVTETGYAGFTIPIFVYFVNCRKEYYLEYDMNLRYEPHFKTKEIKTLEFKDPKPDVRYRLIKAGAEVVPSKGKLNSAPTQSFEDVFGKPITVTHSDKPINRSTITKAPSKPAPTTSSTTTSSTTNLTIKTKEIDSKSNIVTTNNSIKNGSSSSAEKHVACPPLANALNNAISVDRASSNRPRPQDKSTKDEPQTFPTKDKSKKRTKNKEKPTLCPFYANDSAVPSTSSCGLTGDNNVSNVPPNVNTMVAKKVIKVEKNDEIKLPPPKSTSPLFSTCSPGSSPDRDGRSRTTTAAPPIKKNVSPSFSSPQHRSQSLMDTSSPSRNVGKTPTICGESSTLATSTKKRKKQKDSSSNNSLLGKKRAKTKSDSGMDSDYSGTNNASPVEPPSSVENVTSSLFSPDSARSVDTVLHESPASAGSAASTSTTNSSNVTVNGASYPSTSNNHVVVGQNDMHSKPSTKSKNVDDTRLHSLMTLQRKIMTIREQSVAQKVADIIVSAQQTSYECTAENFEFDLFKLDANVINSLFKYLDSSTSSSSSTTASSRCN